MKKTITLTILLCLCGNIAFAENNLPVRIDSNNALYEVLEESIESCSQPPLMDASEFPVEWGTDIDVKNIFYEVTSERPDLQYAYDCAVRTDEQGFLQLQIDYMPYLTGDFPKNLQGIAVGSLTELIEVAQSHLAEESVNIRITNPSLTVPDMNAALSGQVGDTYMICTLNRDATQIMMSPSTTLKGEPVNSKEEALQKLAHIDELVRQVVADCTDESMSQMEKAQSLYGYLTDTVAYDYRYYSDFEHFNDKARTALGALEDHLAICGGYAQALRALFRQVGIPCYIVSGFAGEDHLWNVARIGSEWRLFDATFDAASTADREWRYFNVDIESTTSHVPHSDITDKLILEAEH